MTPKVRISTRGRLLSATFCLAAICAMGAEPSATVAPPAVTGFTRVAHPNTNTVQLEIALRRYEPASGSGPTVWLAAVAHIGETNYYATLQAILETCSLVLFEGVGDPDDFKDRSRRLRRAPADGDGPVEEGLGSLQATLAASLGMAFQLDAINYDRPHFQNSDLSLEQLQALMMKEVEDRTQEGGDVPNPAFAALIGAMDGTTWLGAMLHMGARLLGSSPKLKAMTRLMFIEALGRLEEDMAKIQGLSPDIEELIQVLIRERNKRVMADLKKALRARRPPASVAVLYGAGHMDDLARQLAEEMDYKVAGTTWLPAIVVQPAQAGLTASEIAMIRSLVNWQMDRSAPADRSDKSAPSDQGPKTR